MIPALLATTLAPATLHHHGLAPLAPRVEAIVEAAWDEQEVRHQQDLKNDREMGKKYSEQIDKELKVSEDQEAIARVQRIGAEIAAIANETAVVVKWGDKRLNPFQYEFKLVKDKDVNAFSLPGGFIYVYDGLVNFSESDDEIAGVLAHEVAHASQRHVATLQREQSRLQSIQIPFILLAILTGGAGAAGGALTASGLVGTAVGSGWSVKAEQAADYGGFQYLQKSKYDATGLLTFMERLATTERRRPMTYDLGIYRTHPPSRERADAISKFMRDAHLPIRRSRVAKSCRVEVKPADDGTVQLNFSGRSVVAFAGNEAIERADRAAEKLNAFFDAEPALFELSVTPEAKFVGGRTELFVLTEEDATAAKVSLPALVDSTSMNLKRCLGSLSFRVWTSR